MTAAQFKLPDVGEGLTEAEVVSWHVAVGDRIEINEPLLEIETAKSIVELPSPFAGIVEQILVEAGSTVPVGTALLSVRDEPADAATPAEPHPSEVEKPLILVGTGPSVAPARRLHLRRRDTATIAPRPRSAPPARSTTSTPDPRETRIPIRGVRNATAEAVSRSAFTAPHVTEWLTVDVTPTMDLVAQLRADRQWSGVRVTPLLLVAKALVLAVRRFPEVNASWDEEAQEIVLKHDVNLGIAAATPRGLLVPNIKSAQTLRLRELAGALDDLVRTARDGTTSPEHLARGTITITNIGALGVDAGTPILNPGEAAILAFGQVREMPWVVDGAIVPRKVTQLALSFDHRLVDGELGSNLLAEVGRLLSDPARALLRV